MKQNVISILLTAAAIALLFLSYRLLTGEMLLKSFWMIAAVIVLADQVLMVYKYRKLSVDTLLKGKEPLSPTGTVIAVMVNAFVGTIVMWQMWAQLSVWYLMTPALYISLSLAIARKIQSTKLLPESITTLSAANLLLFSAILYTQLLLR